MPTCTVPVYVSTSCVVGEWTMILRRLTKKNEVLENVGAVPCTPPASIFAHSRDDLRAMNESKSGGPLLQHQPRKSYVPDHADPSITIHNTNLYKSLEFVPVQKELKIRPAS